MSETNLAVTLRARPEGVAPGREHFAVAQAPLPEPAPGEVLVRNRFLSLDPYMRVRMSAAKSYSAPVEVGAVMQGQSVGQVVSSTVPGWTAGEWVLGGRGWQRFSAVPASALVRIDAEILGLTPLVCSPHCMVIRITTGIS